MTLVSLEGTMTREQKADLMRRQRETREDDDLAAKAEAVLRRLREIRS